MEKNVKKSVHIFVYLNNIAVQNKLTQWCESAKQFNKASKQTSKTHRDETSNR